MGLTRTHLADVARSTHLLKIDNLARQFYHKFRWVVDGHEWKIRVSCTNSLFCDSCLTVELQLVLLSDAGANKVTAALSYRLVDPRGRLEPSSEKTSTTASFQHPLDSSQPLIIPALQSSSYFDSNSLTVECTVIVFKDPKEAISAPSCNLQQHLGELLASQAGSDVTFTVAGESFAAHKNVLAARSPVFKAQFFGEMQEKSSGRVEIKEMEAPVFGAMLRFMYTDAVPELHGKPPKAATSATTTTTLAQHLLVAADRYGLDRLKVMCERRLASGVDASSVAAMLALAEQHGCAQLKAKCVEFITGGSLGNFHAVLKSDGFKDLELNHPALLTELPVAAHGRMEGLKQ